MLCTIYSHHIGFNKIVEIFKQKYPDTSVNIFKENESQIAKIEMSNAPDQNSLVIRYRERQTPSYQLLETHQCPLSQNLKGFYGYVSSFPAKNEKVKAQFLKKITTLNCEFSLILEQGQLDDLKETILLITQEFDAVVYLQAHCFLSEYNAPCFLNKNLQLIIDTEGNCDIENLKVNIAVASFDAEQMHIVEDQKTRRQRSENICKAHNIPIYQNPNSLFVASETAVNIRTKDEIVDRAIALCYVELKSEGATQEMLADFEKKYTVRSKLTPNEWQFAENESPTQQELINANWRAESFHTLLWALSIIDDLRFPTETCNISDAVTHLFSKTEQEFRAAAKPRTAKEILDQNDLILRLHWACVNARLKNEPTPNHLNPSVIYERHYALNWLVHHLDQDWDNITTNT